MAQPLFDGRSPVSSPLADLIDIVPNAIVSKPILDTPQFKQILFAMAPGQEISRHQAPFLATVHILEGSIQINAGDKQYTMTCGHWLLMPPNLPHQLTNAKSVKFLLTLIKT